MMKPNTSLSALASLAFLSALGTALPAQPALAQEQQAPRYQYVWRHDKSYNIHTTDSTVQKDLRTLVDAQTGDCIVVERAGRRYVITDPSALKHATDAFAPMRTIGEQMGELGKQQSNLGKQQSEFGKQMSEYGQQLSTLGKQMKMAKEAGDDARLGEIKQQMQTLGEQMKTAGKQMRPLSDQMRPFGEKMRELGQQMRSAGQEAEIKMNRVIDTAFLQQQAIEQK